MMRVRRGLLRCLVVGVVGLEAVATAPRAAFAAPPTSPAPAGKVEEARAHYDQGLKLYDDGNFDAARVEFERAYELAPTFRILYNLGLVHKQQSDYVGALRNFESYIAEGGSLIPDARRAEVTREITELTSRTALVDIATNLPGADIAVDDVPVGRTPFRAAVRVNPGRRRISAAMKGKLPVTKVIEITGADHRAISFELLDSRTVIVVERPTRRVPWVGWAATVALAAGAGITGYDAVHKNSELNSARNQPGVAANPDDLESRKTSVRTFSILSDSMTGAAVIVGAVSLYYTIKWGKETNGPEGQPPTPANSVSLGARPGGVAVFGSF